MITHRISRGLKPRSQKLEARSQSPEYKSSASLPLSVAAQPAAADEGEFDKLDKALRAVAGIDQHAVAASPSIAPIWNLFRQGFNIHTEIIPGVKAVLARAKPGTIKGWGYFVGAIREQRFNSASVPLTEFVLPWPERLDFARREKTWNTPKWGPMPHQPNCLVPAELLLPVDGQGWTEWEPGR